MLFADTFTASQNQNRFLVHKNLLKNKSTPAQTLRRGRLSATNAPFVFRKRKENHFVGLLTCAFAKRLQNFADRFAFPVSQ
jgi:hypothetical protein